MSKNPTPFFLTNPKPPFPSSIYLKFVYYNKKKSCELGYYIFFDFIQHHWLSCALASIFYVSFCYTLVWFFTNRDRTPNFVLIIGFLTSKPLLYIYQYYLLNFLNKNIYFGAFHGPKLTAPFVGKPMWEIDVHHLQ